MQNYQELKQQEKSMLEWKDNNFLFLYWQKGNNDYRQYYEQTNLISQEIMKAKSPVIESGTNYLKWTENLLTDKSSLW